MDDTSEKAGCRQRVMFWAAIAAILALVVAVLGIGIQAYQAKLWPFALGGTPSSPSATCQGTSDNFQSASLDPEWAPVNLYPNASPLATYAITPGELRLTAPTGVDLDGAINYNAPRILQSAAGDFTIETTVALNLSAEQFVPNQYDAYQGAGVLLWQDEDTYIRVEQGDRDNQHDVELILYKNRLVSSLTAIPTQDTSITLTVQRQGDTVSAWWSGSDGAKHQMGSLTVHLIRLEVGLALVNNSHQAANVSNSASFSGFAFTCG